MSVNVTQNVWHHHFQSLVQGRGTLWEKWLKEVAKIEAHYEFDENYRFFTTSCDPYMGHTFRLFLQISP
jgi:hypothetical protein